MTYRKLILLVSVMLLSYNATAQQSAVYTSDYVAYQKAITLYNNKQYLAAQSLFEDIEKQAKEVSLKSDCAYYKANCAVRLGQQNADTLIEEFVEMYPTSTKRNTAFLDVGNYYFNQGKYAYSRKWFDKVEESGLSKAERDKFYFNYGYSLYSTKDQKNAKKYLKRIVDSKEYGGQAKYYLGFMAYEGDDYNQASEYFEQVSDKEKYQEKLSYYQADLNFKLGNFEKAMKLAKDQLPDADNKETSELSKIIGECYFNLSQYEEAIPYLKNYKGKKGKWNNTDYYQLGYAYYKQGDYTNAISEFNKIIDGSNAVAQNAYYHLGESYIKLDKKQEGLNAFRNASDMDFDSQIQEDAWLNYAKLSYEIGNAYQSVPQVLNSYLKKYPESSFKEEVETLLIDSYITSKNYEEAFELLQSKRSFEHKVAFQKVTFYRGIELYNEGLFTEAKSMFEKSLGEPRDAKFVARATYWNAETDYQLSNFNDALVGYKQFVQLSNSNEFSESKNSDYNLAYTYFKLKQYEQATSFFEAYIASGNANDLRLNDAFLRLGDGHFVTSKYKDAISAYKEAIKINALETDYATFQKAMSYGYIGDGPTKIKELITFIKAFKTSALRDDAMYELGNSYVKANQVNKAMSIYDQLILEYKGSPFISKALLREGLSYYNNNENEQALTKFKRVANQFPNSEEALQAVATARLIYIDLGRVDDYANWVKTLNYINVSDAELDNTTYVSAEKQYLDGQSEKAIKQLNSYLLQFENGIHALKAHFYLAQLYSQKQLPENARPHYEYVVSKPNGEYTEEALVKLSDTYLTQKENDKAIITLKRLIAEANRPQNKIYAQSNLMKLSFENENYDDAVDYAQLVLSVSNLEPRVKTDAQIIIARSAIATNDEAKAKEAYATVEETATGALAAEALYFNSYFKNKEGQFEASNTVVQQLVKDYSSYKYYAAKGLILMAKNFYELNDAFQATYILESVITNFSNFTDVVEEAQLELDQIKSEEAKTNSSVETENEN